MDQSIAAYDPAQWHDLCVALAGASGALLGLAFVAISFNLDPILADEGLPGRAVETLVFFAYPLAASIVVLVPGLSHVALGVGIAVLTAVLVALLIKIALPRWRRERDVPLSWRLSHAAPGVLLTALSAVATVAVVTSTIGGLYWLGGTMALATVAGLVNSWVLLVEIKR
jgi:energy-converting hydrogenase Eha subunit A